MELFSDTFKTLERGLSFSSAKQKVISQNIANSDTPHYKAKDISKTNSFGTELQSAIQSYRTDERHLNFQAQGRDTFPIVNQKNVQYNNNGNSVDVDKEMTDLASNQIYYNALSERLAGKFNSLENVIRGGK